MMDENQHRHSLTLRATLDQDGHRALVFVGCECGFLQLRRVRSDLSGVGSDRLDATAALAKLPSGCVVERLVLRSLAAAGAAA
jgi:hypothetical protein